MKSASRRSVPNFLERHPDSTVAVLAWGLLTVGTVVYRLVEGWSWVDSFYFSSVAATTVGFGDLTPTTDVSKVFTVFYIFGGVTLIAMWLNTRLKHRAVFVARKTRHERPSNAHQDAPAPDGDGRSGDADTTA